MSKYIIDIPDDMIVSRTLPTLAIKGQLGAMTFAIDTGIKLTPYKEMDGIINCHDCKYAKMYNGVLLCIGRKEMIPVNPESWCSNAKRKEDG